MHCIECGNEKPDGARFCLVCGTAGFWIRAAAFTVDFLILLNCQLIAVAVGVAFEDRSGMEYGAVIGYVVAGFGQILYFTAFDASQGQATLGKRAVGIMVTDRQGRRISFGRSFGRLLAQNLNLLTFGIGYLMVGMTAQNRGLHDFVAGTVVVRPAPRIRLSRWARIAACCAVAVPLTVIVAVIARPGWRRVELFDNEMTAIGSLRAIERAQGTYQQTCGGFASELPALTRFLPSGLLAAPTLSGYTVTLSRAKDAVNVLKPPKGCEGTVTGYIAYATPIRAGSTGNRYFVMGASGAIYQDTNATFANQKPLR